MLYYNDIYEYDLKIMKDILNMRMGDDKAWKLLYEFYIDPDLYPYKSGKNMDKNGIQCKADGLISIKRIFFHECTKLNGNFIKTFEECRKYPIFFFPVESKFSSINCRRFSLFGDRIDHTLFDLKRYYDNKECMLSKTYGLNNTKNWLKSFNSFKELVDWFGIINIFVNNDYNVYDLEKDNVTIIQKHQESYPRVWSEKYYNNLKDKIIQYNEKCNYR